MHRRHPKDSTRLALLALLALALALCALLLPSGGRAQITRLIDASIVQECIRDNPAADATVDVNCTSTRNMLKMIYRATPTSGAGEIARIVLNSPEFAQVFNNRSSGSDPRAPQITGFRETSVVVSMSELRVRYATRFWMMVPEEVAVWAADSQPSPAAGPCTPSNIANSPVAAGDCMTHSSASRDSDGNAAGGYVIQQSKLLTPQCFQLNCGDCQVNTFHGGNDRNEFNRERFWWAGSLMRVYRIKPEPLIEYTINVTITDPDGVAESIVLGLQQGFGLEPTASTYGHSDNTTADPAAPAAAAGGSSGTAQWAPQPDDVGPGRLFQTVGWSPNRLIRARLISQGTFGQAPPLHGVIIARDSETLSQRGYHESRENPRALSPATCAIFTRTAPSSTNNTKTLADSGVAVCPVPLHWMYGQNNRNELRIGTDCCSCLGITQQTWFGVREHQARSCWNTHYTCIPGHDYWSTKRSRTPRYFMREMQRFRKRQYCLLCNGKTSCGLSPAAFDALDMLDFAGIYGPNAGNGTGPAGVTCDWGTIGETGGPAYLANRADRVAAVQLQAPPSLPMQWDNTGRANMWMYRGQMFLDPPDNLGMSVELVVDADALFSRVIERIPRVRIEAITDGGAACTVVVGVDGALFFQLVNESPFAGSFSVELSCADPAYTVVGENRIGIGIGPAPSVEQRNFLIAVSRPNNVPSTSGGQCTLTLFDAGGVQVPDGGTLTQSCREEDKAFTGATGSTGTSGSNCKGTLCGISDFVYLIVIGVAVFAAVVAILLIAKKVILKSGK